MKLYELWNEYLLVNENIQLGMMRFSIDDYTDEVDPTEEELQAYLEDDADRFRLQPQRRYAYVKVTREELRDGATRVEARELVQEREEGGGTLDGGAAQSAFVARVHDGLVEARLSLLRQR